MNLFLNCNEIYCWKIARLIKATGLAGYGAYTLLRLHLKGSQRIILKAAEIPALARMLSVRPSKLEKVVQSCVQYELFVTGFDRDTNENYWYCDQTRIELDQMPRKSAQLSSLLLYLSLNSVTNSGIVPPPFSNSVSVLKSVPRKTPVDNL